MRVVVWAECLDVRCIRLCKTNKIKRKYFEALLFSTRIVSAH